jgi:hypothetical protein
MIAMLTCMVPSVFVRAVEPAKPQAAKPPAGKNDAAAAAAQPPSQDDIKKAFDAKDYQQVIQMVSKVLPLKGKAASAYDRYELLTMKGESLLRLKQPKAAGDAFVAAAKETDDPLKAATARATQRILREAKGQTLRRRFAKKSDGTGAQSADTADVFDPAQRDAAFRIVYDDLKTASEAKIKEGMRARTLPPISEAIDVMNDLHDFEVAATGGDAEQSQTRRELVDRARKLIGKELGRMERDVQSIENSASSVARERYVSSGGGSTLAGGYSGTEDTSVIVYRKGLTPQDRTDLKDAIVTSKKIIETCTSLERATDTKASESDELIDRAKEIGRVADKMLSKRY